ncbi:LysR family transcriptional regulator [Ferrimonas sp. YFM]|uniref:LysR family transcriptional regulator n=1 Tax=Ferrimonas sp. YFM TaxID=3028878 RepID=UPI002572BDAB|nr:LysR family transcriptional regulator [Ferrimonas sp. YFM]BDY06084.1 LysR family transcriptional regulator [Ferrimonas sp. YFM]
MNIKTILAFYYSAEFDSFSKAAELLDTSQPNISNLVKKLESDLGVELFQRRQGKVTLSENGRILYPVAIDVIDNYKNFLNLSQQLVDKSPLTIVTQPRLYLKYVAPIIDPEMLNSSFLHIKTGELSLVKHLMEKGEADIVITEGLFDNQPKYRKRQILDVLYFNWAKSKRVTFSSPVPTITHSRVWDHWHDLTLALNQTDDFYRVMTIDTPDFSQELIQKGIGIGLLPQKMIESNPELEVCQGPTKGDVEGPINFYVRHDISPQHEEVVKVLIANSKVN